MPEFLKALINRLSAPEYLLPGACVALFLVLRFYRTVVQPRYALGALLTIAAIFLLSLTDENFLKIVSKPDNIPIIGLFLLVGFFSWLSLRKAAINDERIEKGLPPVEKAESEEKVLVWPDLVFEEFICLILVSALLIFWSIYIKAPLEEPANPNLTPNPSKAPWYFLGLQEMLVYYDPWLAGVVFPTLVVAGLVAIPYIDLNPKGQGYYTFAERKFAITNFFVGFLILWVLLIYIGTFERGPNWNVYGPYEYWDKHKLVSQNNINLSDIFWIQMVGSGLPKEVMGSSILAILVREAPGFLLIAAYFVILPPLLAKTAFRSLFVNLGFLRYNVMVFLFLSMMALPIKMLLRWTITLKYFVAIPEYFFNI